MGEGQNGVHQRKEHARSQVADVDLETVMSPGLEKDVIDAGVLPGMQRRRWAC